MNLLFYKFTKMEALDTYKEKGSLGFIQTFTGIFIDPFNPEEDQLVLEDMAHALSNLCRFGGHSAKFYSVAQHAVRCSYEIEKTSPGHALEALFHDNTEAYLVDIPTPIKRRIPLYEEKEDELMKMIFKKYYLEFPLPKSVKDVDRKLLYMEVGEVVFEDNPLEYWSPEEAKQKFLDRFDELNARRYGS